MTASLLARVVQTLQERQIPFALIGAAAMAAHGVSRSTFDTDLLSVGSSALDDVVWRALAADGVDVDIRHGDETDPLLGVVRCSQGDQTIDLVVGRSAWQREVIARATPTEVFSLSLPIVTVADLILFVTGPKLTTGIGDLHFEGDHSGRELLAVVWKDHVVSEAWIVRYAHRAHTPDTFDRYPSARYVASTNDCPRSLSIKPGPMRFMV